MKKTALMIKTIVAVILLVSVLALSPLQTFAAASTVYISEIKLGYGSTPKEAYDYLTGEGYQIVTYGHTYKNTKVEEKYQKYADLNQGGGSKFKKDVVVYMGYKTTQNKDEAITDIAAMNMMGGYSFAQYEELIDKYRESTIKPFLDRFMSTVQEYRDNYNSSNAENKAKAVYIHDLLNLITDDDTGMGMGDLLLNKTSEDYGYDEYKKLSNEEKKKYGDLTVILMQGNTSTVFAIEQMLTLAADTNEKTWIERLVDLGPDGLLNTYTQQGKSPSDAQKEMAQEYEDTALKIAAKWEDFRNELLEYKGMINENTVLEDDGDEPMQEEADATPDEENAGEAETGQTASKEGAADENIPEATDDDVKNVKTADQVVEVVEDTMVGSGALCEEVEVVKTAYIYNYLTSVKYGDSTLCDFFLKSSDEVSGDNIAQLYPMVSVLTKGQRAGTEFLSLKQMVQCGSTENRFYAESKENTSGIVESTPKSSVYSGVNREHFGSGCALTDEKMRADAQNRTSDFNDWAFGITNRTLMFAGISLAAAVPMVISCKALRAELLKKPLVITDALESAATSIEKIVKSKSIYDMQTAATYQMEVLGSFSEPGNYLKTTMVNYSRGKVEIMKNIGIYNKLDMTSFRITETSEGMRVRASNGVGQKVDQVFPKEYGIKTSDTLQGVSKKCSETAANLNKTNWSKVFKTGAAVVFSLAFLAVSGYTVYCAYNDIKAYYNVEMTIIPKYIVDKKDITYLDDTGKTLVKQNEDAYYEVVRCNRASNAPMSGLSKDYGDVNGDVAKQWLALYTVKNMSLGNPIVADSFRVVVGTTEVPEKYDASIHMFGEKSAANMTNSVYTYNDSNNGIYVYYKTDADANPGSKDTGSVFSTGYVMIAGGIGLIIGAVLGLVITSAVKRKKVKKADK